MSDDKPESPEDQDENPDNVVPFSGGEISDESLRRFNELMAGFPSEDASEEEVEAFMKEVMEDEAGSQMLESFAEQLKEGGLIGELLDEEEEPASDYTPMESPARIIFKVELCESNPPIWRRFSLPGDASFFDLHLAIQDSFGWEDTHLHRFEMRTQRALEATFSSNPTDEEVKENDFCGISNRVIDVSRGGWPSFHYVYDFGDRWEHLVTFENLVGAGEEETSLGLGPQMHDGERLCPPEDCGGIYGFCELLSGESEFADEFPKEFLEKLREGEFHPPAVQFRDPMEVLKLWGLM